MKYFGTDGIRKKADDFTIDFLAKIVKGLVDYAGDDIKVLIGGDTRESSEWILADFETILETFGIEYGNVGVLPTPAINYCFYEMGFDFAIDVTASHNPYTDNGIKIFERGKTGGEKISLRACEIIEEALAGDEKFDFVAVSLRENLHQEAVEIYQKHLSDYLREVNFAGFKIGMDCANGATSVINKSVFEKHGAEVSMINVDENYDQKINHDCGSTHIESLQKLVRDNSLDYGVAFDGDGDRCILVDGEGNIIDGDQILVILAEYLKLDSIVATVMANQGLLNWAKEHKMEVEITSVGDSNVKASMDDKNIKIGGEQSGHIILPNEATGDGMLTALMITKVIAESKRTLQDLTSGFVRFPQIIVNMPASAEQKSVLKEKEDVKQLLLDYAKKLEALSGRLLVRPSGTEELIRITMWGEDEAKITKLADELKVKLEEVL